MFERFKIKVWPKCLIDSYGVALELVRKSDCWGLTPDILLDPKKDFMIKPKGKLKWDAPYSLSLIWRKDQYLPSFYQDFLEETKKVFKDQSHPLRNQ